MIKVLGTTVVYSDRAFYAGWPANHGAWQWGDELLVGFMRGPYLAMGPVHKINEPFEMMQARSLDGGETWASESVDIPVDFDDSGPSPEFSLKESIIRVRGNYDHGGDRVPSGGGFWVSSDRGHQWRGPFRFDGLSLSPDEHMTARTSVVGDLVFLSKAKRREWGSDSTFLVRHNGKTFDFVSTVCADDSRAVMPSVAEIDGRMICVMRRLFGGRATGWIDAFCSDDDGESWRFLSEVGETGHSNGNPPALIAANGLFVCAYGNRSEGAILARTSSDLGQTWGDPVVLRGDGDTDIGYPRLFSRSDGSFVCVYYWADKTNQVQHIASTIFKA